MTDSAAKLGTGHAPPGDPGAGAAARSGGPLSGGLGIVVFVVLFGSAAYLSYRTLTTAPIPEAVPVVTDFLCIETNQHFRYGMKDGEHTPVLSPFSQKRTGYPTEKCLWTRDGKRKLDPTYVVLNHFLGKSGDTICPDCGRVVVGHNPPPPETVPLASGLTSTSAPTAATTQPIAVPD